MLSLPRALPAVIMSDAAVEQRRALIKRKKREREESQPPGAQGLTEEQQLLIRELMDAQTKTFDTTFSHFKDFRVGAFTAGSSRAGSLGFSPRGRARDPSVPCNLLEMRILTCPLH